jgi:hypothetical protein
MITSCLKMTHDSVETRSSAIMYKLIVIVLLLVILQKKSVSLLTDVITFFAA